MKKNKIWLLLVAGILSACGTDNNFPTGEPPWEDIPGLPGQPGADDGDVPEFNTTINSYQG